MGSIKPSLQGTTSAKQTERKMHLLALTTSACLLVKMSEAAVAVGVGRLNPENPSECLDPDTGLNHTLGVAWNIPPLWTGTLRAQEPASLHFLCILWVSPSRGPLLSELHGPEPALPLLLPEKHLPGQAGRPHQPHRHRRLRG